LFLNSKLNNNNQFPEQPGYVKSFKILLQQEIGSGGENQNSKTRTAAVVKSPPPPSA